MQPDPLTTLTGLVTRAVVPSRTEVIQAKRHVLEVLEDRAAHRTGVLVICLSGQPPSVDRDRLIVPQLDGVAAALAGDPPSIRWRRLLAAGYEAVAELAGERVIVASREPENGEPQEPNLSQYANLVVQYGGGSQQPRLRGALPLLAPAYRLAHHLLDTKAPALFDADLFVGGLDGLELDSRTRRCIAEALDAYQARLYLACANMLGAAFEGAWYAAGERLRTLDPRLSGPLDRELTAKLERLVAEIIRRDGKGDKTLADELLSQAALLRELRNYGVHPPRGRARWVGAVLQRARLRAAAPHDRAASDPPC